MSDTLNVLALYATWRFVLTIEDSKNQHTKKCGSLFSLVPFGYHTHTRKKKERRRWGGKRRTINPRDDGSSAGGTRCGSHATMDGGSGSTQKGWGSAQTEYVGEIVDLHR